MAPVQTPSTVARATMATCSTTPGDKVLDEVASGGIDSIFSSVSVTLNDQGAVENLRLTGKDNINGTGNELDNLITGKHRRQHHRWRPRQ